MKNSLTKLFVLLTATFMCAACGGNNQGGEGGGEETPAIHVHSWSEYKVDGDYHYRECTVCHEKSELEHHTGGTSTCEHKAICSVCGAEYGALDEHQFEDAWHVEAGNQTQHYHECTVCHQKEYANHVFNQEVVADEYLVGTKTTVCGESNYYYKSCVCGAHSTLETDKFFVTNAHDFSLETVLDGDANLASPADCTHAATYYYVCSKCGAYDSEHPEHVFSHGEPRGHHYGALQEEVKTFGTYHSDYYFCNDCGTYFEPVEEGGHTSYVESTYDQIFDDSKCQCTDTEAGTETNPYIMTCKEDFLKLRELVNSATTNSFAGKYFKLMNDVNFNNDEDHPFGLPIAYDDAKPFSGIFDGQNHTLSNIYFAPNQIGESVKGDSLALFSRVTEGTIKNLKISNVIVKGTGQRATGLVARLSGGTLENIEILSGNIEGTTECAGLVGCIVHDTQKAVIKNCVNRANIKSTGNAYPCLGGILGATVNGLDGDFEVDGCANYGLIDATKAETLGYSGGVIGLTRVFKSGTTHTGDIKNNKNFGNVTSSKGQIGGIVGVLRAGLVEHCYQSNEATVTKVVGSEVTNPTELYGTTSKLGHIIGEIVATGTGSAEHNCFCDADGDVAHVLGAGQPITDEATCHSVGHNGYGVCMVCGEVFGEIIPELPHNMEYTITSEYHEHHCTNEGCAYTEGQQPHNMVYQESEHVDATPSTDGLDVYVCSVCGYRDERVLHYRCDHCTSLEYVAGVTPTCHTPGMQAYYRCTVCGTLYSDSEGNNEVTAASLVLPVVAHNFEKHDAEMGFAHSSVEYYTCTFEDHDESEGKYFVKDGDKFVAKEESEIFLNEGSYGKDGYGTEENPYVILNATDLWAFKTAVNGGDKFTGKFVKLGADLDITGDSNTGPIGNTDSYYFGGTFDGANHTINGFTKTGNDSVALFSRVTSGTVKNVNITNVNITTTGTQRSAGIVARANGATISNCHVLSGTLSGKAQIGGVVAFAMGNTTIENCSNSATINGAGGNCGGIVGAMHSDATTKIVRNCVNNGPVTNTGDGTGGILGGNIAKAAATVVIENCVNNATISGKNYVGGIVGIAREANQSTSGIIDCTNKGNIVASGTLGIGGVVGLARFNLTNCSIVHSVLINDAAASTYTAIVGSTLTDGSGDQEGIIGYIAGCLGCDATQTGGKLINADGTEYVPEP